MPTSFLASCSFCALSSSFMPALYCVGLFKEQQIFLLKCILKNNGNGRKGLWMILLSIYVLTHAINSDTSHMSTGLNIGLQCFWHVWSCLTCWHWNTTLHSHFKFELPVTAQLTVLVLPLLWFSSPQLHRNKHQPPVFFYPHPSFFTPSNFFFHSPPPCTLSQILRIHPPHRLPLSTAAAKNKTGWCGGPMGEAQRWWNSTSPAWAEFSHLALFI